MGVREVDKHEKYLGLPTIIGRSKKAIFAGLKGRIWKKVNGWKEKLLSKPGKEILIKAVAQAIPTYMMSLFALPEVIIDEIHAVMSRFWWGSTEAQCKLHWMSWERLCEPKAVGGMGFRDLRIFNQALLAKQVWRLLLVQNSLAGRVLKARYYKHSFILDARRGYDPSFVWRSLWGSKSLLLEGLKWRVGNGQSIGIWDEAWLPGDTSGKVPTPNIEADPNMKVADLIDPATASWKMETVREVLTTEDANLVLKIPLSSRLPCDVLFWWPSRDGRYTVKSGYWLGRRGARSQQDAGADGSIWKLIWRLNVPPKLLHFLWRICANILPVRKNLFGRHCSPTPLCNFCESEECSDYTIFGCEWVKRHWTQSGFREVIEASPNGSCAERIAWVMQQLDVAERGRFLAIAWSMWYIRNTRLFEECQTPAEIVCAGLVRMVADYQGYAARVFHRPSVGTTVGGCVWTPPLAGFVKINVDAHLTGNGVVGLGAVARDVRGDVVWVGCRRVVAEWEVDVAEAKAAFFGLEVARRLECLEIVLESDSQNLVMAVKKVEEMRTSFGLCVDDLCFALSLFNSCILVHVNVGVIRWLISLLG